MTHSPNSSAPAASGPITRHAVKQMSKFTACLIGATAICLSAYTLTIDKLVPDSKIPATYKWFLLKEVPGPRIIFESGSNSHHAIDTEAVGAALGMTAINIGDNAGYALEDKVSRLETFARPGDVIVLPLEWSFYSREKLTDAYVESMFSETRDYYTSLPPLKRVQRALSLPPEKIIAQIKARQTLPAPDTESPAKELFGTALTLPTGHFARVESIGPGLGVADQSCDDYILGKPDVRQTLTLADNVKLSLARLEKLKARGIAIHFAWPVLVGEGCMNDPAYVTGFKAQIKQAVTEAGFEFLGAASQSLYAQDMQDDTPYHLLSAGTKIHTQKMIGFLRAQGYGSTGTPLDIKTFARHRLLELELAEAAPLKQPAFPLEQNIRMEDPQFRSHVNFTAGWWAFEPYGRWMRDNRAMFRVTLPKDAPKDYVLEIQGITKSGRPERVNVSIEGQVIRSALFGANMPLILPTADLPKGQPLSIFLTLPEADTPKSPFDEGESQDTRSMTLLLQSMTLTAGEGAAPTLLPSAALSVTRAALEPAASQVIEPVAPLRADVPSQVNITPFSLSWGNKMPATAGCTAISETPAAASSQIKFLTGWWDQEVSGRWMQGGEAEFQIDVPAMQNVTQTDAPISRQILAEAGLYELKIKGDFFRERKQAVSVIINGQQAVNTIEIGEGVLSASFALNAPAEDLSFTLKLLSPNLQSPKELGLSEDDRTLTYFLKSASLTRA